MVVHQTSTFLEESRQRFHVELYFGSFALSFRLALDRQALGGFVCALSTLAAVNLPL